MSWILSSHIRYFFNSFFYLKRIIIHEQWIFHLYLLYMLIQWLLKIKRKEMNLHFAWFLTSKFFWLLFFALFKLLFIFLFFFLLHSLDTCSFWIFINKFNVNNSISKLFIDTLWLFFVVFLGKFFLLFLFFYLFIFFCWTSYVAMLFIYRQHFAFLPIFESTTVLSKIQQETE